MDVPPRRSVTTLTARLDLLPGGASGWPGDRRDSDPGESSLRLTLDLHRYCSGIDPALIRYLRLRYRISAGAVPKQ